MCLFLEYCRVAVHEMSESSEIFLVKQDDGDLRLKHHRGQHWFTEKQNKPLTAALMPKDLTILNLERKSIGTRFTIPIF